ncbi:hypothetical protein OFO11_37640, partial [Escherichia coli]|nr:hypothetical protein [Escherichia coli]
SISYGEVHDYRINIVGPPTVTSNSPVCTGGTITITAVSLLPNPSYTLTGPGVTSTTNTTGIFTIPNASSSNNGTFNVVVTSGT